MVIFKVRIKINLYKISQEIIPFKILRKKIVENHKPRNYGPNSLILLLLKLEQYL